MGPLCPKTGPNVQYKVVRNAQSFQSGTWVSIMAGLLRGAVCNLPPGSRGPIFEDFLTF